MTEQLNDDTSHDLFFTSYEDARRFGNALMHAGFPGLAENLRKQYEFADILLQDGDTIFPPARLRGGKDIQEVVLQYL